MNVNPPRDKPVASGRCYFIVLIAAIVRTPRDKPVASLSPVASSSPWHLVGNGSEPDGACYRTDMGSAKIIVKRVYVLS